MKQKDTVKKPRAKFYVEKESLWVRSAVVLMILSAVFRVIGSWGLWNDQFYTITQIILPLCGNLLFILLLLLCGKRFFWMTTLPVLMGVAFFIIKAFGFESWVHTLLCILLYLLVAVLYTATAFGSIRTKWLLVPLFALPFLYHVCIEDVKALQDKANPVTLSAGMLEMSVLCIMLALLCTAFAMKKVKPEVQTELPKIKDPKVIVPSANPAAETVKEETAPEA